MFSMKSVPTGPGINTGSADTAFGSCTSLPAANGGGLFGSNTTTTSRPADSEGLFGCANSQAPIPGGLFGASAATTTPLQIGGLFGSTTNSQPQASGGLFGSTTATSQPQQATRGLFGTTAATSQPLQTGRLFGNATSETEQQTGGLFGTSSTTLQPASTGGLFGTASALGVQQTGGLFGSNQKPTQSTGGLFGNSTYPGTMSAFGSSNQNTGGNLDGFSTQAQTLPTFGQSQQQSVPGVRIDASNIRGTSRFNDLHDSLQKDMAAIDEAIQKHMAQKDEIEAFLPNHAEQVVDILPRDVAFVARKSDGCHTALNADVVVVEQLRQLIRHDNGVATLAFIAVENLKLPSQYHHSGLWTRGGHGADGGRVSSPAGNSTDQEAENTSADLIGFFARTANEMDAQMRLIERNIGEIELHMNSVQADILEQLQRAASGQDEKIAELAVVLRDFEESILKAAGLVGDVREGMTELQLKDFYGNGAGMR